jgi:hypothetical protein
VILASRFPHLGILTFERVFRHLSFNFNIDRPLHHDKMFRSIAAAEKAALEGEGGQEWDTQQCVDLQNELLSVRICSSLAVRRRIPRIKGVCANHLGL